MKIINLLLILLFFTVEISAQSASELTNDTIFYNSENGYFNACTREKADSYSISQPYNSKLHVNKIYYLQSGNVMAAYEVYDKESGRWNNITFTNRIKNGKYEEWHSNGAIRVTCFYTEDKLDGEFKAYYQNGNFKG